MKRSFKMIFIFSLYTLMCSGVLVIAIQESTRQPIGLLVVSMALTPVIVAIFGGLPVNFLEEKLNMNDDSSSTTNKANK
jgi:multisubunit Na+/H+ antiporter MnhC subunit